jgi:hypothetical protein
MDLLAMMRVTERAAQMEVRLAVMVGRTAFRIAARRVRMRHDDPLSGHREDQHEQKKPPQHHAGLNS